MSYDTKIASKLLQINAIKLKPSTPFTWASGIISPIYCDNRISLSDIETRDLIKEGLAHLSENLGSFDIIAGVATAGIAHGALLADYMHKPFCYVRSKAKEHGRKNLIEGFIADGQKVLVVEDLISTGGSSIAAVEALQNAGHEVVGVISIFNYGFPQAIANFSSIGCKFASLSNYNVLLKVAKSENIISESDLTILSEWSKNPQEWKIEK